MYRLAQHAGIPHYQKMSKNVLYERLQRLGQGLERIRRLEERTSGTPLAPSSLFATSSSSRLFLRSAGSLKDVAASGENGSKKRKREEGEEESSSHLGHINRYTSSSSSSSSSSRYGSSSSSRYGSSSSSSSSSCAMPSSYQD